MSIWPLLGNLKTVVRPAPDDSRVRHESWMAQIDAWKQETEDRDIQSWPDDGKLYVSHVVRELWRATAGEAIVTTDVGQHQMWTAQYYRMDHPHRLITSGGSGTMGFGLPSAIGAWFAHPDREIWTVVGDGGFQMTQAELATAVQEGANVKIALMNNASWGWCASGRSSSLRSAIRPCSCTILISSRSPMRTASRPAG